MGDVSEDGSEGDDKGEGGAVVSTPNDDVGDAPGSNCGRVST